MWSKPEGLREVLVLELTFSLGVTRKGVSEGLKTVFRSTLFEGLRWRLTRKLVVGPFGKRVLCSLEKVRTGASIF